MKLTGGLRWTDDQKHFVDIPSELLNSGYGYPVTGVVNQQWDHWTGRAVVNWTPKLDFTDQTLIYGSYAHGYKAGGANPPGAVLLQTLNSSNNANPIHPLTFKPEYIEAFELGTKNTLLDGALTLNGDVFYYNYTGYQISEIIDRTSINLNFNAHVKGAEFKADWEPLPGLKFALAQGFENTVLAGGSQAVDLMDRTAGNPNWILVKPFITQASNCILPTYIVSQYANPSGAPGQIWDLCNSAYLLHNLPGFDSVDPTATNNGAGPAPNNGAGFDKNLTGNQLPNAPHYTTSFTAEYTIPVSGDWAATLHGDFYWQSSSFARVFNDKPYDQIHGYTNLNLSLILNSANGWQVQGYVKNVLDTTAITGDFLNSDDSGLTTNVFLTDPRLFGVRVTKRLDENDGFVGSDFTGKDFITGLFSDAGNGKPVLWIDLGGQLSSLDAGHQAFAPPFLANIPANLGAPLSLERPPLYTVDENATVTFQPQGSDWIVSASITYGRTTSKKFQHVQNTAAPIYSPLFQQNMTLFPSYAQTTANNSESHLIVDFRAGSDVGLGLLGSDTSSTVSLGARFAQFISKSDVSIHARPDVQRTNPTFYGYQLIGSKFHEFTGSERRASSFHGVGPSISWKSSLALTGSSPDEGLTFDWGLNGAILFGRQKANTQHASSGFSRTGAIVLPSHHHTAILPPHTGNSLRSRTVVVPNLGAFAGISYKYPNAKFSFGYRADEYFGAMDGGIDNFKSYNRGFFGPYASFSIGIGG